MGEVVVGTHAGEDLVHHADAGTAGWHKGAALGQQDNEGCLTQEGTLTSHVGTRNNDNLLLVVVQIDIVADIGLALR